MSNLIKNLTEETRLQNEFPKAYKSFFGQYSEEHWSMLQAVPAHLLATLVPCIRIFVVNKNDNTKKELLVFRDLGDIRENYKKIQAFNAFSDLGYNTGIYKRYPAVLKNLNIEIVNVTNLIPDYKVQLGLSVYDYRILFQGDKIQKKYLELSDEKNFEMNILQLLKPFGSDTLIQIEYGWSKTGITAEKIKPKTKNLGDPFGSDFLDLSVFEKNLDDVVEEGTGGTQRITFVSGEFTPTFGDSNTADINISGLALWEDSVAHKITLLGALETLEKKTKATTKRIPKPREKIKISLNNASFVAPSALDDPRLEGFRPQNQSILIPPASHSYASSDESEQYSLQHSLFSPDSKYVTVHTKARVQRISSKLEALEKVATPFKETHFVKEVLEDYAETPEIKNFLTQQKNFKTARFVTVGNILKILIDDKSLHIKNSDKTAKVDIKNIYKENQYDFKGFYLGNLNAKWLPQQSKTINLNIKDIPINLSDLDREIFRPARTNPNLPQSELSLKKLLNTIMKLAKQTCAFIAEAFLQERHDKNSKKKSKEKDMIVLNGQIRANIKSTILSPHFVFQVLEEYGERSKPKLAFVLYDFMSSSIAQVIKEFSRTNNSKKISDIIKTTNAPVIRLHNNNAIWSNVTFANHSDKAIEHLQIINQVTTAQNFNQYSTKANQQTVLAAITETQKQAEQVAFNPLALLLVPKECSFQCMGNLMWRPGNFFVLDTGAEFDFLSNIIMIDKVSHAFEGMTFVTKVSGWTQLYDSVHVTAPT